VRVTSPGTLPCRACHSLHMRGEYRASERMFGLGGEFVYSQCDRCGSLSLVNVPALDAYYPDSYYSYTPIEPARQARLRGMAYRVAWSSPYCNIGPARIAELRKLHVKTGDRLLDVGSGSGQFLRQLQRLGFRALTGVDAYAPPTSPHQSFTIIKGDLTDVAGQFDVIMFTHSLEHMADPVAALTEARQRLASQGHVLVEVPVIGYAWRRYETRWVQLDAPRHITLFAHKGIDASANLAGLRVERVIYNSGAFQFWGSDAYTRGETLVDATVPILSWPYLRLILRYLPRMCHAWYLNRRGDGDQALFVMTVASQP
jgi:SAM-dependent methyltransferase